MGKDNCTICGTELNGVYYSNYYACEYDDCNKLCGDGECWAEWMQDNTHSHTVEQEDE